MCLHGQFGKWSCCRPTMSKCSKTSPLYPGLKGDVWVRLNTGLLSELEVRMK